MATATLFYPPTCVYLCVPCLRVLTLVYLIYMHSIDIYLCLLRLTHCMRLHVQLRYLCLHTWAYRCTLIIFYVVPVSENFILTIFLKCRDTFWVESYNHQLLTYLSKRVHFGTATFHMRMFLALLDWVCSIRTTKWIVIIMMNYF